MPLTLTIRQPENERISSSYKVFLEWLETINNSNIHNEIIFDLSNQSFIYPFLILPIAADIYELKNRGFRVSIKKGQQTGSYLSSLLFPEGLNALNIPYWENVLEVYKRKTFLPICIVPAGTTHYETSVRERILSVFEEILLNQLNLATQLNTSISYIISEYMANIVDHAGINYGMIMVQNYPSKGFLDICILDCGEGLLSIYQKHGFRDIITHEDAIKEAINGRSTKESANERGYGLKSTRKMLVEGLGGEYLLHSGNAFFIWNRNHEQISSFPGNKNWKGTLLFLRIPKNIPVGFNYTSYLE